MLWATGSRGYQLALSRRDSFSTEPLKTTARPSLLVTFWINWVLGGLLDGRVNMTDWVECLMTKLIYQIYHIIYSLSFIDMKSHTYMHPLCTIITLAQFFICLPSLIKAVSLCDTFGSGQIDTWLGVVRRTHTKALWTLNFGAVEVQPLVVGPIGTSAYET